MTDKAVLFRHVDFKGISVIVTVDASKVNLSAKKFAKR